MHVDDLLRVLAIEGASDLHLKPMRPPMIRLSGKLKELEAEPLPPAVLREMICQILTEKQREALEEQLALDFAYSLPGVSRFRGAVYYQRGTLAAVFRRVPFSFPSLEEWGLPEVLRELTRQPHGLILVTGPSGSGKSSTLAALIKEMVGTSLVHIITIEDPIEFLLSDALGTVSQREIGTDTPGFAEALHDTLRQDPDVILVGEMRDPKTIATVLTAAETGHLVLSTLHANSASQSIDRILDSFPEGQQRQVRMQLAQVLKGVISLSLVERVDGSGMIAAVEVLRSNPKILKLIAEGKVSEIQDEMERSVAYEKMQTMNQSLIALVLNGVVSRETALASSPAPGEFALELRQFMMGEGGASGTETDMADSLADFSKILELREIRRLYDESQERFRSELAERDACIDRLRAQISTQDTEGSSALTQLREERDKLAQQVAFQKQEMESKIEKLQQRIKELSATATEPARSGLFRR